MVDSTQARPISWPGFRQFAQKLARTLAVMDEIRLERKMLARLDDRALQDIGIDRATAIDESARGWFDIPTQRLRD